MKFIFRFIAIASLSVLMPAYGQAATISQTQSQDENYRAMHQRHHGGGSMQGHHGGGSMQGHHGGGMMGQGGHQHDEVNMPGLRGKDTTQDEVADLAKIFREHKGISRQVVNLPDGIKTVTQAQDEALRDAIINHVSMMITRIEEGRNPEVMIQSPTLDKLFAVYDQIETEIELTDTGVAVIQRSDNAEVVALLQTHAAEVSDMAMRGMAAVHERMSKSH